MDVVHVYIKQKYGMELWDLFETFSLIYLQLDYIILWHLVHKQQIQLKL